MTRGQKISKLANAIRAFKGLFQDTPYNRIWIHHPQPARIEGIIKWASRLRLNVFEVEKRVKGFTHPDDLRMWLNQL